MEGDDGAFFAVDAADFLAEAVEDDRALGHGVDFHQVIALGADAVDDCKEGGCVDGGDDGVADEADEELDGAADEERDEIEEVEGPEEEDRESARATWAGRGRAVVARFLGF